LEELIHYIASSLIENPDNIQVSEIKGDQTKIIELKIDPSDIGKIIGRQGRTANALRTIVNAAALKSGERVLIEIVENQPE